MNELASVMHMMGLPVFALDADGYYVYENELAQDFLGYEPADIAGRHITDLIVFDPPLLMAGFDGLRRRGYFCGGVRYRHRNGSLVDADVNTFRRTCSDGTPVFVALVHPLAAVRRKPPEVLQPSSEHGFTGEEMRLLLLLAEGFSNEQVARLLSEREDMIDQQVRVLLEKMPASSRTEAVVLALKQHILL